MLAEYDWHMYMAIERDDKPQLPVKRHRLNHPSLPASLPTDYALETSSHKARDVYLSRRNVRRPTMRLRKACPTCTALKVAS